MQGPSISAELLHAFTLHGFWIRTSNSIRAQKIPHLCISILSSTNQTFPIMASATAESKTGDNIALSVKNLDFSYSGASKPCLKNINLELPKGSRCLLVGDNGAGENLWYGCTLRDVIHTRFPHRQDHNSSHSGWPPHSPSRSCDSSWS